jgi:2-polyprenyl-6-methoxyphenol hydroxylase-like FAD-dependent oxidoreductase
MKRKLDIGIVGGGIGGLCLAQGLKKAGIPVQVYERDEAASSRWQGFRIHISPEGSRALHQCLPQDLWDIFNLTGGEFGQGFSMLTEQLEELLSLTDRGGPVDPIACHRSISRITLRSVLLSGLGETVHFGKRFARYEEIGEGRVAAYFGDGSIAEASVLVAADGVNSAVRKQALPHAEPIHTGVIALAGKVPLTDGVLALVPDCLLDGPALVIASQPASLFMAMWKRSRTSSEILFRLGVDERAAEEDDYLILGLGARTEYLVGLSGDPKAVPGPELKQILRRAVKNWHPDLRKLAEMLDETETTANPLRTSRRIAPWPTTHITLLGDAIHSMTPYRGIGANVALRDAALLCTKLVEAAQGQKPVLQAIHEYERAMRSYAFEAVDASLQSMEQAISRKKNLQFQLSKTAMRVMNRVPALKRRVMTA